MTRFQIVTAVLDAELAKPYASPESDCFILGLRLADALDPTLGLVEKFGGTYTSLHDAQRVLRRQGFKSLRAAFEAHFEPCAPAAARFGDLVIINIQAGPRRTAEHVGVCLGTRFRTKLETGPAWHTLNEVTAAFRTGPRRPETEGGRA